MGPHKDRFPPDEGCHLYPSCLSCPLPKCFFDLSVSEQRALGKRAKTDEIRNRLSKGESISDLAKAFGISIRTIQRIVGKRIIE